MTKTSENSKFEIDKTLHNFLYAESTVGYRNDQSFNMQEIDRVKIMAF